MKIHSSVGSMIGEPVIKNAELWALTNDADLADSLTCLISEFQMEDGTVVIHDTPAATMDKNLIINDKIDLVIFENK